MQYFTILVGVVFLVLLLTDAEEIKNHEIHPHLTPLTLTYQKVFPAHLHPLKIMPHPSHPSPLTPKNFMHPHPPPNIAPPTPHSPQITHIHYKYCLTNRHSHKIQSNNSHLLKRLFNHKVM